ncbi:hypothetical protein V6N13_084363 [Hibiscus sabdariffa]
MESDQVRVYTIVESAEGSKKGRYKFQTVVILKTTTQVRSSEVCIRVGDGTTVVGVKSWKVNGFRSNISVFHDEADKRSLACLLLLVGEDTVGKKQWFNPGCFCLGFESGLFASFPLFSAADLLAVHDIHGWFYNFLERVSGQAMLSRSTWTNGGTTECSSCHFMGVDFESMGKITFAWLLQRAKTYIARQKLQTINLYFPLFPCTKIKGKLLNVGPAIYVCKIPSTSLKVSGFVNVIPLFWSFCMIALCKCVVTILLFNVFQGNRKGKAYVGPHSFQVMKVFTSFRIVKSNHLKYGLCVSPKLGFDIVPYAALIVCYHFPLFKRLITVTMADDLGTDHPRKL